MNGNSAIAFSKEEKRGAIIKELRGELLLALKYAKGENNNPILVEKYILESLEMLSKLENLLK